MKNYYVYRVEDRETREFYIGSRGFDGDPSDDTYLGSYAVWKPIKERLEKTILQQNFSSMEEAILYEREIIKSVIDHPLNRNYSIPHPKLSRDNIVTGRNSSGKIVSVHCNDPMFLSGEIVGLTKGMVLVEKDSKRYYVSVNDPMYKSGELKHANTGKFRGNLNRNFGKKWVNDGNRQYLVDKNSDTNLQEGTLQRGKITNSAHSKTCWVTDGVRSVRISENELNSYLQNNWTRGREKTLCKKTLWYNNGIRNIKISKEEIDEYKKNGWKRGYKRIKDDGIGPVQH
jgi:hypothetical protein